MSICLSIAVFFISGLFSNLTLDPGLLPRFLAGSILVLGFVSIITIRMTGSRIGFDFSILHRVIFSAFVCYLAICGLSLISAINLAEGLFEWLKLFMFTAFFYTAVLVISKHGNGITILVRGIIFTATILSAIGICQYYHIAFNSIPGNFIIYATLAHKNLYASALFLMLPFALYGVYKYSGFWQVAGGIAILCMSFGIGMARARTIWAAISVATIAVAVMVITRHRKSILLGWNGCLRFYRAKSAAGMLLLLILTTPLIYFNDKIVGIPSSTGDNKLSASQLAPFVEPIWSMNTLNERFFLWGKSLAMAQDKPLFGVGLGQWRLVFPAYGQTQQFRESEGGQAEIFYQRPHNDFLWVLTETGIIGLLSYLVILGIAIFYTVKIYFKSNNADSRALAIFMLFGLIGYLVIAFFSFPKERIVHNIFLMLNLACIVSVYHQAFPEHTKVSYSKILILHYFAMLLLILCGIVGYIRLESDAHLKNALAARQKGDWQTLRSEIDKADSLFYRLDPASVPLAWYRGIANYSMGQFGEALNDFKRAYQIHPNHIHVLNNLGTSYAQSGDFENAAKYYKKALEILPGFIEARINLGVIYFHMGDLAMAQRCLVHLDQNNEDPRILIYLQLIENRLDESI